MHLPWSETIREISSKRGKPTPTQLDCFVSCIVFGKFHMVEWTNELDFIPEIPSIHPTNILERGALPLQPISYRRAVFVFHLPQALNAVWKSWLNVTPRYGYCVFFYHLFRSVGYAKGIDCQITAKAEKKPKPNIYVMAMVHLRYGNYVK